MKKYTLDSLVKLCQENEFLFDLTYEYKFWMSTNTFSIKLWHKLSGDKIGGYNGYNWSWRMYKISTDSFDDINKVMKDAIIKLTDIINIKDIDINELELTERLSNCLKSENINTLHELIHKTESELKSITNFGKKCLMEVKNNLAVRGLSLKEK